ncbi:hypothetical protein [Actinomadura sp. 21ATH]|uniref:hypothetical protein n=1 Tax=Actinomadura sp. 21ATH TaxID=1735444 RepID=UPI0035C17DEB
MAFPDQIAAADRAGRKPAPAVDPPLADLIPLAGDDPAEARRAARALARQIDGDDLADMLGLTLPDEHPTLADGLVGLIAAGNLTQARAWIGDCTAGEIDAIRMALRERRRP